MKLVREKHYIAATSQRMPSAIVRPSTSKKYKRKFCEVLKGYLLPNVDDILNPFFWVEVVVEFILCTFVLTIVILAVVSLNTDVFTPNPTHFGLFAGFIIMSLIEGYGPLCGASVNPAAVWGFFLAGRISFVRACFFMGAEIAGAAAGAHIGFALIPVEKQKEFKPLGPGPGVTAGMGMAIEGILTFNLLVIALSCTNPKTKTSVMPSFPIAFACGTGIMLAGTHTGGLQNPLITFGPAVITHEYTNHFQIYWAGPFIGATVGSIFYSIVILAKEFLNRPGFSSKKMTSTEHQDNEKNAQNIKLETYKPSYESETSTRL